ncbi:hypothetical protein VTN00DRAFT_3270 [Thermoascus crustaceus]|uniref:uncharacterized protein n=1 Tax=Thermoascus crustaceus TaxID=5088 RepID=UPI00374262A2
MVLLRLTVKVLPREQLPSASATFFRSILGDRKEDADTSAAGKPATFLLVLRNPEEVTLGGLAGMIQQKWRKLRPDAEPLEIKKLLDDEHDDDLDADLTVADVFVDNGKALADGLDQRATVRVVQKPAPYAPVRFPSVAQDWNAAAQEYERKKQAEERAKLAVPKFPPIEEVEEEPRVSFSGEPYSKLNGGVGVVDSVLPYSDVPVRSVERDEEMLPPPNWGREPSPVLVHDSQENEVEATPQSQMKRTASRELGGSPTPVPPPSKARRLSKEQSTRAQSASESRSTSKSQSTSDEKKRKSLPQETEPKSTSEAGEPAEPLPESEEQSASLSEENQPETLSEQPGPPSEAEKQTDSLEEEKQTETSLEEEQPKSASKTKKQPESASEPEKQPQKEPSVAPERQNGLDVEMTDVEPDPPQPQSKEPTTKEPSISRDSPAVVIDNTATGSWNDQILNAVTRKRKKSSEKLPPKKEPRLELTSSPSSVRSKSEDHAKAKDAKRRASATEPDTATAEPETSTAEPASTAETQVGTPSPLRRRERAPSYSGPQRRLSFGEKDASKPGLGLGITKSPPRKQQVMLDFQLNSSQDTAKHGEDDPFATTPLFPSSAQHQPSSQQTDATPTAQTPALDKLKKLPSALRSSKKDSPFDKSQERRSVSFAAEDTVATPAPAPRNKSKKSTLSSNLTSTPDSARPTGTMVFPTNVPKERLEQYMNEAAQKVQKVEDERKEWDQRIETATKENADPEYIRLLREAYHTWEDIVGLEKSTKKDDMRRANRMRQKLANKRKNLEEMEASMKASFEEQGAEKAVETEAPSLQKKSKKKSQKKTEGQTVPEDKVSEKDAEKKSSEKTSQKAPSSKGKNSKRASTGASETEQAAATPETARSDHAPPKVNGVNGVQSSQPSDDGYLPSTEKVRSMEETRKSTSSNETAAAVENPTQKKSESKRKSTSSNEPATATQSTQEIIQIDSSDESDKENGSSNKPAPPACNTRRQASSNSRKNTSSNQTATTAVRNITRIEEPSDASTEPATESDDESEKPSDHSPSGDDNASSEEENAPEISKAEMLERLPSASVSRTASSSANPSTQKQDAKKATSDNDSSSSESESEDSDDGIDALLEKKTQKPNGVHAASFDGPASRTSTPVSLNGGHGPTKPSSFSFSSSQPTSFQLTSFSQANGTNGVNGASTRADRATLKSILHDQRTELAQKAAAASKPKPAEPVKPERKHVFSPPDSSEEEEEDSSSQSDSEDETAPSDAERGDIMPTGKEKKIKRPLVGRVGRVGRVAR